MLANEIIKIEVQMTKNKMVKGIKPNELPDYLSHGMTKLSSDIYTLLKESGLSSTIALSVIATIFIEGLSQQISLQQLEQLMDEMKSEAIKLYESEEE